MKIYISGSITGCEGYMEKFAEAERVLVAAGHTVFNPAKINASLPKSTKYEEYMERSLNMLNGCDIIFMLDGWKESRGANAELEYAIRNCLIVAFERGRG